MMQNMRFTYYAFCIQYSCKLKTTNKSRITSRLEKDIRGKEMFRNFFGFLGGIHEAQDNGITDVKRAEQEFWISAGPLSCKEDRMIF